MNIELTQADVKAPFDLASLTVADIVHVYSGRSGCACGCRGKHTYNPMHREFAGKDRGYPIADDECNTRTVANILAKLKNHPDLVEFDDEYVPHLHMETEGRLTIAYLAPRKNEDGSNEP